MRQLVQVTSPAAGLLVLLLAGSAIADQFNRQHFGTRAFSADHWPVADSGGEPPPRDIDSESFCLGFGFDCRSLEHEIDRYISDRLIANIVDGIRRIRTGQDREATDAS